MARHNEGFNSTPGSVRHLIWTGDKEFLKKIGMTQKEAAYKLHEYLKLADMDLLYMERWYHDEVQQQPREAWNREAG